MTKSELIARDKGYIETISGAVYRENDKCEWFYHRYNLYDPATGETKPFGKMRE